jgi:hypothetical protein
VFGSRGFVVYLGNINFDLVDIDFRLRLPRLLHDVDRTPACEVSLSTSSASTFNLIFVVYFTDVDFDFTFINTYFFARSVRHQGLLHNHQTRGAMVASG